MAHIKTATRVDTLVDKLASAVNGQVEGVIPVISTVAPSLMIVPRKNDNIASLRELVAALIKTFPDAVFKSGPVGDYVYITCTIDSVRLDVVTGLPAVTQNNYDLV
jgi:hypothetical protein